MRYSLLTVGRRQPLNPLLREDRIKVAEERHKGTVRTGEFATRATGLDLHYLEDPTLRRRPTDEGEHAEVGCI
jgi:hypothetical protein